MNYLIKEKDSICVDGKIYNISPLTYLNKILLKYFKEYKTLIKYTRKVLKINKCLPLYVSKDILLVQTSGIKSDDYFVFNYYEIKDIMLSDNESLFIFKDNTKVKIKISKYRMKSIFKNLKIMCDYITLNK